MLSVKHTAGSSSVPLTNYDDYVRAQLNKTDALASKGHPMQWVTLPMVSWIAGRIRSRISFRTNFALCHGARSGREVTWFRTQLPGVQVWGTELSLISSKTAPWTIPWDFHEERPEWKGQADFVYSNALDHSYNATLAILRWMAQIHDKGAVVIHWSKGQIKLRTDSIDIFGPDYRMLVATICSAGHFAVNVEILRNAHHLYFVNHATWNAANGKFDKGMC